MIDEEASAEAAEFATRVYMLSKAKNLVAEVVDLASSGNADSEIELRWQQIRGFLEWLCKEQIAVAAESGFTADLIFSASFDPDALPIRLN